MKKKIFVSLLATSGAEFGLSRARPAVDENSADRISNERERRRGYPSTEAFRQGLRELGYVEGKNILVEYRYAEGGPQPLSELAEELVRLKVDVIVTTATEPSLSAQRATTTIPIVMGGVIRWARGLLPAWRGERELFETVIPDGSSGTLVLFDTCDGIRNRHTTVFANTLRKHLGRIHRYFLKAGKRIIVNDEEAMVIDPLELESEGTETFSDEEYPITTKIDGRERHDMVRVRISECCRRGA